VKIKKFTFDQLGMMSITLRQGLFPQPTTHCLFVDNPPERDYDNSLNLYFSNEYYNKLVSTIRKQISDGSYSKSNAEKYWLDLSTAIFSAAEFVLTTDKNIIPHFLAKD
jgi:hypothetical protein